MLCDIRDKTRPGILRRTPRKVQLFGWDSQSASWYGPNEMTPVAAGNRRLAESLASAPGRSWYGPVNNARPGELSDRFFALVHNLDDCAVAMIYCDESRTGPAEIVAVIPSERRSRLRPEFAFEFLAFASFLGSISVAAAQELHEKISGALAETETSDSLVFSISTGLWSSDLDFALSCCVERVAAAMLEWLRAQSGGQRGRRLARGA